MRVLVLRESIHGKERMTINNPIPSLDQKTFHSLVRMKLPEDVSDARTGDRLYRAATLPDTEAHFEILSAPTVHLLVVAATLPKVVPVDREQSTGHRGTVRGTHVLVAALALLPLPLPLVLRHIDPVKVSIPREAPDLKGVVAVGGVVEVLRVDHVYDRHHNTGA